MEQIIKNIVERIKEKVSVTPKLGVILGSGLGNFANLLKNKIEIPYESLPGMPKSTVEGHSGKFVFGYVNEMFVVLLQGRFHMYEGYAAKETVLPVYILKELGVETLVVTNAAGGVNLSFKAGDIMAITDHINFTGQNPLVGGAIIPSKTRFIDMSNAYDKEYVKKLNEIAKKQNITLKNGTYIQFLGPNYETPAEVRMARILGADAVGMSTVMEVIAATQAGLRVAGLSVIANMAAGVTAEVLTHQAVLEVMQETEQKFTKLLLEFIKTIN